MINREVLLKNLMNLYFGRLANWDPEKGRELFEVMSKILEHEVQLDYQKQKGNKTEHEIRSDYAEFFLIIQRFHNLMSDPEVRSQIVSKGVTKKTKTDFINTYSEILFSDHRRNYDMSELFDDKNIQTVRQGEVGIDGKRIVYQPRTGLVNSYQDHDGGEVSIQQVGELDYVNANLGMIRDSLTHYKVSKRLEDTTVYEEEVFSNIKIIEMQDEGYREAVLQELLGRDNREFSNAGGYVGEIVKIPVGHENIKIDSEVMISGEYYYRINDRYMIKYVPAAVTAAVSYQKEKEKMKGNINANRENVVGQGEERA